MNEPVDKFDSRVSWKLVSGDVVDKYGPLVRLSDHSAALDKLEKLRDATNQCRLAFAGMVSVQSAIDKLDALGD